MITFKERSFVVEVPTLGDPIEEWLTLVNEMIDVLQSENEDMHSNRYQYLNMVKELLPDWETAKKMSVNTNVCNKQ